jgi:long-chain acyl-CoA synthetase
VGGPPDPATLERPWLASYPPGVPADLPLPEVTVTRFLEDAARDFPERTAIAAGRHRIDHVGLRVRADTVATALSRRGVTTGDRVLIGLPNGGAADRAARAVAARRGRRPGRPASAARPHRRDRPGRAGRGGDRHRHGAPPPRRARRHPAADRAGRDRRRVAGRRSPGTAGPRPRATCAPADAAGGDMERAVTLAALLPEGEVRELPPAGDARPRRDARLPPALPPAARRRADPPQPGRQRLPGAAVGPRRPGRPRGPRRPRRRVRDAGLALGWLAGLLSAATVVLLDDPDPGTLARAMEREGATLLVAVPRRLTRPRADGDAGRRDLTSLRVVLAQGLRSTRRSPRRSRDGPPARGCVSCSGSRRPAGSRTASRSTAAPPPGRRACPSRAPWPPVVDLEDLGALLPPGIPGRLLVHGPQVALGYLGHEEASAERFVHGWLVTDDLAVVDDEGIFTHLGRRDAVVDRDGWLVSLRAVETAWRSIPRSAGPGSSAPRTAASWSRRSSRGGAPAVPRRPAGALPGAPGPAVGARPRRARRSLPEDAIGELDREALRRDLVAR